MTEQHMFAPTPLDSPITEHAVMIAGLRGDEGRPQGSGMFIAPGIVLTARHLVEGLCDEFGDCPPPVTEATEASFALIAVQFPGDGSTQGIWRAEKIWLIEGCDLAVAGLRPANGVAETYTWTVGPWISALPPSVGERIHAFGYADGVFAATVRGQETDLHWGANPMTTLGLVTQVFEERADRVMRPFSCFETSARFDRAMSGGPVFNEAGHLCGIICSSFSFAESESGATSYVNSVWPALGEVIDFEGPGVIAAGPYALHQLLGDRLRRWDEVRDRIFHEPDEAGVQRFRLRPIGE